MKGLSMHQAFRRSEYWREYVETFGKEALHGQQRRDLGARVA